MKKTALFWTYLKDHLILILFTLCAIIICALVFSLYSLPLDAVLYTALLCAVPAAIFSGFHFYRYVQKHRQLTEIRNHIAVTMENLPPARFLLEMDYQNLISALLEDKARLMTEADRKQGEMTEYFTLWAHQIKTPLSAMRLLLQSKDYGINAELMQELFETEQYVDIILQYLRLNNASTDFVIKKYALADIVRQAIKAYSNVFIYQKIKLDFREMDILVLTDEKWLVFVLKQILSNALKYTDQGQISIYLDEQNPNVLVIEDTGIGIAPEDIPRIFEHGYTGYNGRLHKKSTGIGLYLCKRILNKLSHPITITATAGVGTKVKIDFTPAELEVE